MNWKVSLGEIMVARGKSGPGGWGAGCAAAPTCCANITKRLGLNLVTSYGCGTGRGISNEP